MDDLCVHCGDPIVERRTPNGPLFLHLIGGRACEDDSGHIACPSQGGFE